MKNSRERRLRQQPNKKFRLMRIKHRVATYVWFLRRFLSMKTIYNRLYGTSNERRLKAALPSIWDKQTSSIKTASALMTVGRTSRRIKKQSVYMQYWKERAGENYPIRQKNFFWEKIRSCGDSNTKSGIILSVPRHSRIGGRLHKDFNYSRLAPIIKKTLKTAFSDFLKCGESDEILFILCCSHFISRKDAAVC